MLFLRKSKRGFTLIELMVVVAIIGILALLGLRAYTGQMEKSKNAVVKANAGTIQTLIQSELADDTFDTAQEALEAIDADNPTKPANMQNPYDEESAVVLAYDAPVADEAAVISAFEALDKGATLAGIVYVLKLTNKQIFYVIGTGAEGTADGFDRLSAMR